MRPTPTDSGRSHSQCLLHPPPPPRDSQATFSNHPTEDSDDARPSPPPTLSLLRPGGARCPACAHRAPASSMECDLCESAAATVQCAACDTAGVGKAFCPPCSKGLHATGQNTDDEDRHAGAEAERTRCDWLGPSTRETRAECVCVCSFVLFLPPAAASPSFSLLSLGVVWLSLLLVQPKVSRTR